MAGGADRLLYREAGVLLVRATTYPGGRVACEDVKLSADAGVAVEQGSAWLAKVWQCSAFRLAVEVASPVLSRQVHDVLTGARVDARQVRRMVRSVASYLLRWRGRATPFGLFAGVGAAKVGDEPLVRWGDSHRVVLRADMQWLDGVIGRLEQHRGLLERLSVVANSTAFVRGDRLVVPGHATEDELEALAPLEVSVRCTGPVRTAMDAAGEPIRFGDLAKVLAVAYPAAQPEQITTLLGELVSQHFLITSLRAPMARPDALGHLREQLGMVDAAEELPDLAGLVQELGAIHDELLRQNTGPDPAPVHAAARPMVADRMRAVCDVTEQPLITDLGLDCEVRLPETVLGEAEAAASTLLRLTPYPFGYPRWKDFHVRFRQRYGPGAVVPVQDLLADSGLGMPAGYLGSPLGTDARTMTARDDVLLAMVQKAVMAGDEEIVLTEGIIRELVVGDPAETLLPPRVELAFQLHATSPEAVRRGDFRLQVTGVPRPGSSMAGRFAGLLPDADRRALARSYATASTGGRGAIAAQLSFAPRRRRSENVARTPQLLEQTIPLAEHRGPHRDVIAVRDLAVSADSREFQLVQLSTGRHLEPRVLHALEAGTLTPPLARFLAEVTTARCAVYKAFDWGAAVRLPYLPRLRSGRTVLSPARWMLTAADLPVRAASMPEWEASLDTWCRRLRVPLTVMLCETDLRMRLDLRNALHRELLRARLARTDHVELREAPAPDDLAFVGRAHEFLLPLHVAHSQSAARQSGPSGRPRPVERDAGHLPGHSSWLYAQIYGHPVRQDEILTDHLHRLIEGLCDLPLWWFRRHRDVTRPDREQHLDLYLRLPSPDQYGLAAGAFHAWANNLRRAGLVSQVTLATHHPETGRYGHGNAMRAAEAVFAADSAAALAQIAMATRTGLPSEAITAASLVGTAVAYASTPEDGLRWITDSFSREQGKLDQHLRKTALRLTDPSNDWAQIRARPGGELVARAWEQRRTALAAYREQIAHQRAPDPVLRSLLHMHHVRSIGVSPDRERIVQRLARAAALRQIAHSRKGEH
ncbi:lantibiotic dehydratase [Streptomyces gamaensis]|uniref:Lantibiotic dehydratase n=1 Tax=Streptomyces gamaensis TaxID=1763542 RepID=A0ABW0Z2X4_9ACTN